MSPRTKEQYEVIRSEKEALILDTALSLFAKNGFLSTPVSLIAKEAGISKGLMYNYFKSKEELLYKIIIGKFELFMNYLKVSDINNVQKHEIINFIDGNLLLLKQDPDFYKLYFSLSFQPSVFALLEKDFMRILETIAATINNYYSTTGFENSFAKTRFLLAVFDGIGIHYIMDPIGFPLDETRNMIINLL